jgi:iron complex outermembrane receptor protein
MLHSFKQNRFEPNAKGLYAYGEGYVPDYTVFNFKSSYEINHNWKVSLGVENVFNKLYQPSIAWWSARDMNSSMLWERGTL